MKQLINAPLAPKAAGAYSHAVVANGLVYCSGQVGLDPETNILKGSNIETQAEQAFTNIKNVLEASSSNLEQVISMTCYLTSLSDFPKFNEVFAKYLGQVKPCRTTVGVAALPLGALIEITVIAEVNQKNQVPLDK